MATGIHLTYARPCSIFEAIIEPGRDSALIGAIVLESRDLVIDCPHQTLCPRDPKRIISNLGFEGYRFERSRFYRPPTFNFQPSSLQTNN